MSSKLKKISKFLSWVLRHHPEGIGLTLDDNGWADISELIELAAKVNVVFDKQALQEIVDTNDKKRFAISEDGLRIRANQGHSIAVDLNLTPRIPPDVLYHGTARRFLDSILAEGLSKMKRHHVHLSERRESALAVGARYGKVVLLAIDAKAMHQQGHTFYRSENGVWLVDAVASEFIRVV